MEFIKPFYEAEFRYFHNFAHILSGLDFFDNMTNEQFIAWMFHDIIYLPGSPDNEKNSADYACLYIRLNNLKVDEKIVYQIILDTKLHIATIKESQLILDIDMLCFSLLYQEFYKSRANVFKEYEPLYGKEDTIVGMKNFLDKIDKIIYSHNSFLHLNELAVLHIENFLNEKFIF